MSRKAHPDPPSGSASAKDDASMPDWFVEAEEAEKSGKTRVVSPEEEAAAEPSSPAPDQEIAASQADGIPSGGDERVEEALEEAPAAEEPPVAEEAGEAQEEAEEEDAALWKRRAEENREKWMRAMAELENFRKRSRREIESSINFANANLLRELLDVLDDFERAQDAANEDEEGSKEAYREGIRLIYQRFVEVLRKSGLERIPAKGEVFDPNLHEAVSQIETDEVESGHIAHVVQQGYRLKGMVLRPAKVVVAK